MKIKVSFPNPNDYTNDIDAFVEQLELSVYHIKKAVEKAKNSGYLSNADVDNQGWFFNYRIPVIDDDYDKYAVDIIDPAKHQDIFLEINE